MGPREDGGIVSGWLVRITLFVLILGFIVYEVIATAITAVTVDGAARDVAQAAATAYRDSDEQTPAAEAAAAQQAAASGVELISVTIEADDIVVAVTDRAPTIVIHELGWFEDMTTPNATARRRWRV